MNSLKLKKLYAKTVKESPHFCDSLLPNELSVVHYDDDGKTTFDVKEIASANLGEARRRIAKGRELGNIMWNEILNGDVWEATLHMAEGDNEKAVDSLYAAVVTIMRTMDVLEGRQPLGDKTKDG